MPIRVAAGTHVSVLKGRYVTPIRLNNSNKVVEFVVLDLCNRVSESQLLVKSGGNPPSDARM
jgi:hypothetical protein